MNHSVIHEDSPSMKRAQLLLTDVNMETIPIADFVERLKWRQLRGLVPKEVFAAEWVNGFVCSNGTHFTPAERRPRESCSKVVSDPTGATHECGCAWLWKIRGGILLYLDGYIFGKPISIELDGRMHHFKQRPKKRKSYIPSRRFVEEFDCRESYRFSRAQLLEWFPGLSWKEIRKELLAVRFRKIAVRGEDGKVVSGLGRDPISGTRLGPFEFYKGGNAKIQEGEFQDQEI